jgi:hypothetical protein
VDAAALVDWRLRCMVDTVSLVEDDGRGWQQVSWLAVDAAALMDLEAAMCGGHSGSR